MSSGRRRRTTPGKDPTVCSHGTGDGRRRRDAGEGRRATGTPPPRRAARPRRPARSCHAVKATADRLPARRSVRRTDASGSRSSLTRFNIELDALSALQGLEVQRAVQGRAIEEVLDSVFGGDKPEAPIGNKLLDGSYRHELHASTALRSVPRRVCRENLTGRGTPHRARTNQTYRTGLVPARPNRDCPGRGRPARPTALPGDSGLTGASASLLR